MPSREGWVTDLPDELCVRAAAAVIRLRPAVHLRDARARYVRYMERERERERKRCHPSNKIKGEKERERHVMLVASYAACSILRVLTQWGATLVII